MKVGMVFAASVCPGTPNRALSRRLELTSP
jgi:hypothetical protein